ncbi:TCR/Tet family MFS transporter [bacterium]|jgi:DHA1 family tetracycline resistance protein-like MFS transporter|nr:TCR/Tet family MFS transporter [bacterium]
MNQARVIFIFVTILLDAIGLGLLIPVFPDILRRLTHNPTQVSEYYGYFMGSFALMQFLASPILGSLSDRFGRKPVLLVSLFGAGIDYIFMAYAPTFTLLFIGRIISGLTGASMTVASSYIADISTDKNRSANFGMIGAAWGLGFIAGPMLGGFLGTLGPTAPFLVAAALNILNFLFGIFVLPESLPKDMRRKMNLKKLNPFSSIMKVLRPSAFVVLIWIYFLLFLAGQVHPVNWTLYTQTKFGWSAREVGLSLSFVGVIIAVSQGLLTRLIIPRIGEGASLTLGIFMYMVSFALFALATKSWMVYAIIVLFSLTGIAIPALQSTVTKYIPANEQGELQGSLVSLGSLSAIFAPILFTYLFVTFTKNPHHHYFPGAAYLAASVICALTLFVWVWNLKSRARLSS